MSVPAEAGSLFEGPGEVRALCRDIDWSRTPLGAPEGWSPTLRMIVRSALDSPFPINLWCEPDLTLIYNDAYRPVLGAKHPDALGRPGAEVWAEIWNEIGLMFDGLRAGGPPVYADDAPFRIEREGEAAERQAAGRTEPVAPNAWFTFSLSPVRDEAGAIVAHLNIVSESTARIAAERAQIEARAAAERAEGRLREVFEQAPAFMAVLRGEDHIVEYVNDAYYQLVGYRELVGVPIFDALPDVRGQGFEELLDAVLETGQPYIGREVPVAVTRAPESESEERFIDLVYYPITEADGTRTGIVAHGSDVTEHVLARLEAQTARAEAEEANQAKSHFLAMMSHEIRTPINAVIGYTDLLDSGIAGDLSERQSDYISRVRKSSKHLLGLVNDLLDLAKIESGEMLVHMGDAPLADVVRAAVEMVTPEAEARELTIEDRVRCSDDVRFAGDDDRVRQIVLNLLSNAIKFTPAGGSILIECGPVTEPESDAELDGPGPWLRVAVEDTGIGIGEDQLARIFEPFVQADTGTTRQAGGTGLGLTISRQLARMMGGDLTVRSEAEKGSRFTIWLAEARPTD